MIRLADLSSLDLLPEAFQENLQEDPFGCRIWAAEKAYADMKGASASQFMQLWIQERSFACFCLLDDSLLFLPSPSMQKKDWEEAAEFLPFSGGRALLCPAACESHFPFPVELRGKIFLGKNRQKNLQSVLGWNLSSAAYKEYPKLRQVFSLFEQCQSEFFSIPPFEAFYLDLSHRLRHGVAELAWLQMGEKLIAAAAASAVTDKIALLSGVAVAPEFQGRGYGKQVIEELARKMPGRTLCVFCSGKKNETFYRSIGFQEKEAFIQIKL